MGVASLVRRRLLDDATISSMIGTRIYPQPQPESAKYPLLTMRLVSNVQSEHLRQVGPGMADPRLQIDVWTTTESQREVLARLVQMRIQGFTGFLEDASVSPPAKYRVAIRLETEEDITETDVSGVYWRRSQDYRVQNTGI